MYEPSEKVVKVIQSLIGRAKVVSYELKNKHVVAHLRNGVDFWVLNS